MYSKEVLDHFHHPRNAGEIAGAAAVAEVSNPVCGDVLKLSLAEHAGRIAEARFKAQGCVPVVACASWLTQAVTGKTPAEASQISAGEIEAALGGLPRASRHASALALAALKKALEKLQR